MGYPGGTTVTETGNQTPANRGNGIQTLRVQEDLDLATVGALYQRGRTAIAGHARLLLLDLSGLSFCDARGLSALVRIANDADAAGCRYGLIAPQPQVAKILRITGLGTRLRVFATIEQARQRLTAVAPRGRQPVRRCARHARRRPQRGTPEVTSAGPVPWRAATGPMSPGSGRSVLARHGRSGQLGPIAPPSSPRGPGKEG